MENVLVTGSKGFLGSAVSKRLIQIGYNVCGVDKDILDVRDRNAFLSVCLNFKPSVIFHLAGLTGMPQSVLAPDDYFSANVDTTISVLEACRKISGMRIVYASSSAVYGAHELPARETAHMSPPENPYAATKQISENLIRMYSKLYGFPSVVLRVFSAFGPGQKEYTALYKFVDAIVHETPLILFDNGLMKRNYVYVDNCIDGMILALNHRQGYDVFNLAQGENLSLIDIVKLLESIIGKTAKIKFEVSPPGVINSLPADINKIRKLWGYDPAISFRDGLGKLVQWYYEFDLRRKKG
jgi:UDP-glucuronate 4-epimerase